MDRDMTFEKKQEFPYDLLDELGELLQTELECPGVYYVLAQETDSLVAHEYYLIEQSSEHISNEAKAYGSPLPHHPDLLSVSLDTEHGGGAVIRFEIKRYLVQHHLPLPDGDTLLTAAIYGMEDYPEYFGSYPAPLSAPRGFTTRYKELIPGVFAIETDTCETMLAVCYPRWYDGFSSYTMRFSEQTAFDREQGIDNTLGFLFFPRDAACLAVFELLPGNPNLRKSELLDLVALHNALWTQYPDYAIAYNRDEQAGFHDLLAAITFDLEGVAERNGSLENVIAMTERVGTEWLRF